MVSVSATVSTRERGIIACSTVRRGKSRIRSSSMDSSTGRSPLSRESSTMCSRSRAVAECSTSCTGSIFSARSSRFDAWSKIQISQPKTFR